MKISNSKKELARIISENGGWRNGEFAAQDGDGGVGGYEVKPEWDSLAKYWWREASGQWFLANKIKNHHQTVLSHAEYFHLYPAPDADGWIEWGGGECPVGGDVMVVCKVRAEKEFRNGEKIKASILRWRHTGGMADIIAYRLHKPEQAKPEFCESVVRSIPEPDEQVWTNPPTIEQLAADYRNAKDYAERKQQEADDAKADVGAKLKALELAGEAIGLLVSPITAKQEPEPELVIKVQVGDEVECIKSNVTPDNFRGMVGTVLKIDCSSTPYLVDFGRYIKIWCYEVKFIRRP